MSYTMYKRTLNANREKVHIIAGKRLMNMVSMIALLVAAIIALFPIYWVIVSAFKTEKEVFIMPPVWIFVPTMQAFKKVFEMSSNFGRCMTNSIIVTVISVILTTIIGSMAAYGLARFRLKGSKDISFYMLSTRFAPAIGFVIPFYLIYMRFGLIDTRLGLILANITINLSFTVWMMKGVFEEIPVALEEAALIDGMPRFGVIRTITLPLARPGIVATAIFSTIMCWNEFVFAFTLTQFNARTLPAEMPRFLSANNIQWDVLSAAGTLVIVPMLIFAFFVQRYLIRGLTLGAVKG